MGCVETRPDLSFRVASLATVTNVTMSDNTKANKIVRQLNYEKNLCFRKSHVEGLNTARIIVYSDSSLAKNTDNSTKGGFLIGLSPSDEKFIPLASQSRKLRRIVQSTLSAEALALKDASHCAILIRDQFIEMSLLSLSIHCYIDNKTLFDSVNTLKNVTEKRLRVDISYIREIMAKECVDVKQVNSAEQLADGFTKASKSAVDRLFNKLNYCHID